MTRFVSRSFAVLVFATLLCSGSFIQVSAAKEKGDTVNGQKVLNRIKNSANPKLEYDLLNAKDLLDFNEYVTPVTVTTTVVKTTTNNSLNTLSSTATVGAYAVQCLRLTSRNVLANSNGNWLAGYYTQTRACHDGSKITSKIDPQRWGETYAWGWGFYGNTAATEEGGVGQGYYAAFGSGQFKLCLAAYNVGCIQESNRTLKNFHYRNGTYRIERN